MTTRVVSLMWGNAWERYGEKFAHTFAEFWPWDYELVVYADRALTLPRGEVRPLDAVPGYTKFKARWASSALASGREPIAGWKPREGYDFRFDANKWMPQGLVPAAAFAELKSGDTMVWLDADVHTHTLVPDGLVAKLLNKSMVCHLGRAPKHSEIGFWACRVMAETRKFVTAFADTYSSYRVFSLPQWHSAWVFDYCISLQPDLKVKDLTPGGRGHVWHQSLLGRYADHLKGARKELGRSPEAKFLGKNKLVSPLKDRHKQGAN